MPHVVKKMEIIQASSSRTIKKTEAWRSKARLMYGPWQQKWILTYVRRKKKGDIGGKWKHKSIDCCGLAAAEKIKVNAVTEHRRVRTRGSFFLEKSAEKCRVTEVVNWDVSNIGWSTREIVVLLQLRCIEHKGTYLPTVPHPKFHTAQTELRYR